MTFEDRRILKASGALEVVRKGEIVDAVPMTVQLACCDLRALDRRELTFCCHPLFFSLPLLTGWATLRAGRRACSPEVISGLFVAHAAYRQSLHDANCPLGDACPAHGGLRAFLLDTANTRSPARVDAIRKLLLDAVANDRLLRDPEALAAALAVFRTLLVGP